MKLSTATSIFVALACMGSIVPAVAASDFNTEITFKSEHEITDTPESLAILEEALGKAADASHDPNVWHLDSEEIVSSSHTLENRGERKLSPYYQYTSNFWSYSNMYQAWSGAYCNGCRRRLGAGPATSLGDDAESHAKWEVTLCEILAETDVFAGVSDCVISFVDSSVPAIAKDVVEDITEFTTEITFKTDGQVYDTEASLEALETALLMAADASHDPDVWFLDHDKIVSFSHTSGITTNEGERKLSPYYQYTSNFWSYSNMYQAWSGSYCNGCRRRLDDGSVTIEDDAESHAKWEATLCELLNGVEGYEGASDCVITFVASA